jgi:diguanylate cyclase (GGDEF)-like protein/PAS domain S-box-containing protein
MGATRGGVGGGHAGYRYALRIALLFVVIGIVWITVSDSALSRWIPDLQDRAFWQTALHGGFILVSAGILFFALSRILGALQEQQEGARADAEKYRQLFEGNPHPMWVYDLETLAFLAVNDSAVRHYGFSREEFLAMKVLDLRPREAAPAGRDDTGAAAGHGKAKLWRHRRRGGDVIDVEIVSQPVLFEGRRAAMVLANDITEQRRMQAALAESEARLRLALRAGEQGLYDVDIAHNLVQTNAEYARMLGFEPEGAAETYENWLQRLHPEDRERAASAYRAYLSGESQEYRTEFRMRTRDGGWRWVLSVGSIVERDESGKPLRVLGTHTDITQLKRAEQRVRRLANFYSALSETNAAIMRNREHGGLFEEVCRIAVERGGLKMAWIGMADRDAGRVVPVASFGQGRESLSQLDLSIRADSAEGRGATGRAVREDSYVVCNDLVQDLTMQPWMEHAQRIGFRASAAFPLRQGGQAVGALSLYAGEIGFFDAELVALLQELARNVSAALDRFVLEGQRSDAEEALRASEARFRALVENSSDVFMLIGPNVERRYISPSASRVFGHPPQVLANRQGDELMHPEDMKVVALRVAHLARQPAGAADSLLYRLRQPDGSWRWYEGIARNMLDDPHIRAIVTSNRDVTERRQAEQALRASERLLRLALSAADMAVFSQDLELRYTWVVNPQLGMQAEQMLGKTDADLLPSGEATRLSEVKRRVLASGAGERHEVAVATDGQQRYYDMILEPRRDAARTVVGLIGVSLDITARKETENRVQYLAHHDSLTGLPNRMLLRDRVEQALAHAIRDNTFVALLFLDLDRFKHVNDSLGHLAGDQLLRAMTERLRMGVRASDTVSRQGGDEFVVLLADIQDLGDIHAIAQKLLSLGAEPFELGGHAVNASFSIGISVFPTDGGDFDTLLRQADTALYHAKESGRNTYRFFTAEMNAAALERMRLESQLRRALEHGEFELHYQAQHDLSSGNVVGAEALLRWHSPELGEVPPAQFVPVAEDSGLIVPIGAWVINEACRQLQEWRNAGLPRLHMAVNLSGMQFRRDDVVQTVYQALDRHDIPPSVLEIEITESVLLQGAGQVAETVRNLKNLGVRLSIDDFGTGYSSLSYLKRFAVDKLKVDHTFVRDIVNDPDDAAIVRAIVQLGHSLKLRVIAEGVETEAQLAFLRECGCHEAQGFRFSLPRPAAEFARLFAPPDAPVYASGQR